MLLVPNLVNKLTIDSSYAELVNTLFPNKSERELFFKLCQYVTHADLSAEVFVRYARTYEQKFVLHKLSYTFHQFLFLLEKDLSHNRQYLKTDFSNYAELLSQEHLHELYTIVPKTETLSFLNTFLTVKLDTEVVFLQLILQFWPRLKDENLFQKFLTAIKQVPLSDPYEFGLEYYDLDHPDQWFLRDTRFLWVFGLKYLAEHTEIYHEVAETFSHCYKQF